MIKDFTNFLTRFLTAVVFTSLLISCQKTSQNQLTLPQNPEQPTQNSTYL